jgi:hypothetical protein
LDGLWFATTQHLKNYSKLKISYFHTILSIKWLQSGLERLLVVGVVSPLEKLDKNWMMARVMKKFIIGVGVRVPVQVNSLDYLPTHYFTSILVPQLGSLLIWLIIY